MNDEQRLHVNELVAPTSGEISKSPGGEVAIQVEDEGVLIHGDAAAVEKYLGELIDLAKGAVAVAGVQQKNLANIAAAGLGAAIVAMQKGYFVRLSKDSVKLLQTKQIVPGTGGYNRMFVKGGAGKIAGQLQWKKVPIGPSQAMAVQMFAVQMALKTAIANVEEAVERVEGKVQELLNLAHAERLGDIVGQRRSLKRAFQYMDDYGALPSADWEALAPLGPELEQAIEKLHEHARRTLRDFDDAKPIQDRAKYLTSAIENNSFGETLRLLVVAQDSMYLWQSIEN